MFLFPFGRINRRTFLKISGLWSTAAALSMAQAPAQAANKPRSGEYDAIVVGAGLGGLCFAGYMAKNGYKVLVLEQQSIPGGYATTFSRDGGRFTFDVSLHQTVVEGTGGAILRDLGVLDRVKFARGRDLFRVIGSDLDITCPGANPKAFEERLGKEFPNQKEGIRGFIREMLDLNAEVTKFFKEGRLTWYRKMAFPMRYPLMWGARKKSLQDYLDRYVSDRRLKWLLSVFWGYFGLPPDRLSGFYYMNAAGSYFRYGGSYPYGGSQAISDDLARFIEKNGGQIRYENRVESVLVEGGRAVGVQTSEGKTISARAVVVNGSAVRLFNDMIPRQQIPAAYLKRINSYRPSISSFQVWLGLDRDITDKITNSHIFLVDEPDPDKAFRSALEGRADKVNIGVTIFNNMIKGYSPPGTTVVNLIFITGYEPWKKLEKDYFAGRKKEYLAKKQAATETLIRRVEDRLIPGLSKMIAVREAATPLTNLAYTLNTAGAIYGYEQSLDNSFMSRISNRTAIRGLYLSSAWGEPGGGYVGVLVSGKTTFGLLMEDWSKG
jgi:phytoene dehydrogenase-like protein